MSRGGFRGRGARGRFVPRQDRSSVDASEIQPPPLYPPLQSNPQPLVTSSEEWDYSYLFTVKQEYRAAMMNSVYYLRAPVKKNEIERYSDKYQMIGQNEENAPKWQPDWSRLPAELCVSKKKKKTNKSVKSKEDLKRKLESLEEREREMEGEGGKKGRQSVGEEEGETKKNDDNNDDADDDNDDDEVEDEREEGFESDNDYNINYFASDQSDGNDSNDDAAFY